MSSWVLWWMIFMLLFFATPIGYGWGYRRWGAPYPRYIQRRRGQRAAASGSSTDFNHESWRWAGDLVWLSLLIGIFWVALAIWWV
jgi:hypothetical protein